MRQKRLDAKRDRDIESLRKSQLESMEQYYNIIEIGRETAGLIHEIHNPLTVLSLNIDAISEYAMKAPEISVEISQSIIALKRIQAIFKSIQQQTWNKSEITDFNLVKELLLIKMFMKHKAFQEKVTISISCDPKVNMHTYQSHLYQVITNLVSNAIDAYKQYKSTKRCVEITVKTKKQSLIITITDHGKGISPKDLSNIFNAFYTTKSNCNGSGLGLYISKKTTEEFLKGSLNCTSTEKTGTTFTLLIPRIIAD